MAVALEGGEWSAARPGRTLPPGKTLYPFYRRLGGPGPVLTGGKSLPHRDSIPDRPASSQPLYRLSYPAHEHVLYPTKISTDIDFHPFHMDFICDPPVKYSTHIFHSFTLLTWGLFCPINVICFSTGLSPREIQITRILYSLILMFHRSNHESIKEIAM